MIELDKLMALALGELEGAELDHVELHVLSCSSCARTLERLVQLGQATRELLRSGGVHSFVLPDSVRRLDALGLISRRYRLAPADVVPCSVGSADVYVLTELVADFRSATRVDLVTRTPAGEKREHDVPFDAESGLVAYVASAAVLRQYPSMQLLLELRAVEGESERVLGSYILNHDAGRQ
jgi:hypothetical protein